MMGLQVHDVYQRWSPTRRTTRQVLQFVGVFGERKGGMDRVMGGRAGVFVFVLGQVPTVGRFVR